ncbi:hypothetical protein M2189_000708 [Bradyrhizobium japonicum]|nr:hypothetical protein [Bradyrhizobium japonicum]MCS3957505.1 hypothetical protein [Bradyrhizobium japonicum]MCS3999254.1 hypothetical protein [Bradyrhizobium japonicum]
MIKIATLPVATRDARERIQRRMCGAVPASLIPGLNMRKLLAILVISCWATSAYAQKADLIVTNAKIVTLDPASTIAQALAVRDGKIVAVGGNDAMEGLIGPATRRVDAGGRTIIPGLIDSHIHAVRAGLTYATEVNWIGAKTIGEAMERLRPGGQSASGVLDHRGRWLERIAIRGEAAADPGRGDVGCSRQSRLHPAVLFGGADDAESAASPRDVRGPVAGRHHGRTRRVGRNHGLVQRLHCQHLRAVRSPAETEFRRECRRNPAVLHGAQSSRNYRDRGSRRLQHLSQPLRRPAKALA